MRKAKRRQLEAAGWRVGDAADFLELSPAEVELIETKLALASHLKAVRKTRHWTQTYVATRIESSQSRVAKMEAGDASVSIDLLLRSLFALGVSREEVAEVIGTCTA